MHVHLKTSTITEKCGEECEHSLCHSVCRVNHSFLSSMHPPRFSFSAMVLLNFSPLHAAFSCPRSQIVLLVSPLVLYMGRQRLRGREAKRSSYFSGLFMEAAVQSTTCFRAGSPWRAISGTAQPSTQLTKRASMTGMLPPVEKEPESTP